MARKILHVWRKLINRRTVVQSRPGRTSNREKNACEEKISKQRGRRTERRVQELTTRKSA